MLRFWDCAIAGCPKAAAIDVGSCERCESMYCAEHIRSAVHECEPLDDDDLWEAQTTKLVNLRKKTKNDALLRRASELSGGMACRLDDQDPLGRSQMGGKYVHLQLLFEDGTVWLARILQENHMSFSDALSNQILLSECATLRWLEALDLPTPRLHGYGLRGDPQNEVGVAYMIIDKLPGRPFDSVAASEEQKAKVLSQWVDVLCKLREHPFNEIGSLQFDAGGAINVGPIASVRTRTLPCIGPFESARDYYSSWANTYLQLISDGQLFSAYSVEAYLMFKYLKEQVKFGPWLEQWQGLDSGPFFLKHMDDKGDHILIDDNFQITGIIDWTFARTAPAYEAFSPSLTSEETRNLCFRLLPRFNEEDIILGQELQHRKAARCYFGWDDIRRFLDGPAIGLGLPKDKAVFALNVLVETFDDTTLHWHQWRRRNLNMWKDDPQLATLLLESMKHSPMPHLALVTEVPRLATCSWAYCERPAVRSQNCSTCMGHLCAVHGLKQHLKCPPFDLFRRPDPAASKMNFSKEVEVLLSQLDVDQLLHRASSLRQGEPCKFYPGKDLGDSVTRGYANYTVEIVFSDGVKWLTQIPRVTEFSTIPADLAEHIIESEYTTLKLLETLDVPVPKAHEFGLASDPNNLVKVSYILTDNILGELFSPFQTTPEQKLRVYNQYADILIKISHFTSKTACFLVSQNGETEEVAIASNKIRELGKHGPFATPLEYFTSIADFHLDLIADGQLYTEYPKEAFLFYYLLRNRAAPILAASSSPGGFFLKHVDDEGYHIVLDEEDNIKAITDWQCARFVPACEAFGPSFLTVDLGALRNTNLTADDLSLAKCLEEKGRGDLAEFARGDALARRFHAGLGFEPWRYGAAAQIMDLIFLLGDDDMYEMDLDYCIDCEWDQTATDPRPQQITSRYLYTLFAH
ncbi:hypothetical protein F4678DRAFT_468639 [Xylaria arbuscula]|nr:hypothetical protein F4678DRAFT_468639 [Xylaria arbuscula]